MMKSALSFLVGFSSVWLSESLRISESNVVQDGSGHKLLVNTHVAYGKVLDHLLSSLSQTAFQDWQNVIVVVGGSEKNRDPYVGKDNMTFIETTLNGQDVTALAMLSRFKEHPLVHARTYFNVPDSSTFGPCFPDVFKAMSRNIAADELITAGKRASSFIAAFGRELVDSYGGNFDKTLNKRDIISIEHGKTAAHVRPLSHFAKKWTILPERRKVGEVDLYETGYPRYDFYYQDFDIHKFILWGRHGDMQGHAQKSLAEKPKKDEGGGKQTNLEGNKAAYFAEECPRQK